MAQQITIRARYPKPSHPEPLGQIGTPSIIHFRHPAYPDTENILISLPALDGGGVHYGTAHAACAILADFRWDGNFSLTLTGSPVDCGFDDVLTAPNYYFCVPGIHQYDVVANFASSVFPHAKLPGSWLTEELRIAAPVNQPQETSCTAVVLIRDISCRVTHAVFSTEVAHLVPKSEHMWYTQNSMLHYSSWVERGTPNNPRNAILLRSDVHTLFDEECFVIVPKSGRWVAHVLDAAPPELAQCFHNVHVQPLSGVAVEFLFARFMWAIHAHSPFALGGGKRALLALKAGQESRERVVVTAVQYSILFKESDDEEIEESDDEETEESDDGEVRRRPRRRL